MVARGCRLGGWRGASAGLTCCGGGLPLVLMWCRDTTWEGAGRGGGWPPTGRACRARVVVWVVAGLRVCSCLRDMVWWVHTAGEGCNCLRGRGSSLRTWLPVAVVVVVGRAGAELVFLTLDSAKGRRGPLVQGAGLPVARWGMAVGGAFLEPLGGSGTFWGERGTPSWLMQPVGGGDLSWVRERGERGTRALFPPGVRGCKWVRGSGWALDEGGRGARLGLSGCSCGRGAVVRLAGDS